MGSDENLLAEHYADPYHCGECEHATHAAEGTCLETGCRMRVALRITRGGEVEEAWFEADGCAICEALASIVMQRCEGRSVATLRSLTLDSLLNVTSPHEQLPGGDCRCCQLPLKLLHQSFDSPLLAVDDDLADGTSFGGPSLREEC